MGSEFEQIKSLMKYAKSLEEKTIGKDFERYRRNAALLDECRKKKFPNLERLGMINKEQQTPEENNG